MTRAALLIAASAAALLGATLAAVQEPTFRSATRTVAIYATVTDRAGRLVPDLQRDDFSVADNSERQAITVFGNQMQPITVVILLDRSASVADNFRLVEEAAAAFVGDMGRSDRARIGSFSNRIVIHPQDFTSDRDELLKILRTDLLREGPTPLWNAVNVGITSLLRQKGRRVVLLFTDGVDQPIDLPTPNASPEFVTGRAEEEDVMIYAIGLKGENDPDYGGSLGPLGGRHGGGGWEGALRGGFRSEKPAKGLRKIAKATGGGYFELTSVADLAAAFRRVADELHHQYVLGFTPVVLDGKMHRLDVRITRHRGMTVRARSTYLATGER